MKKLVLLNIALTVAVAVYVFIFVPPPISRATPTPTLTDTPLWVGPTRIPADTDTPGAPTGWTPPPTRTPGPTATPTPEPPSLAPGLVGPADGSNFKPSDDILLMWDTPTSLSQDEWYEVQLWREGEPPKVVQWVKEGTWKVEGKYYPGRYQWRILVVRGKEDQKEANLSPPSQTWSFSWLSPVVQTPTAPPIPHPHIIDLTVYLRGTNNAEGFVALSGARIDAGTIYNEGGTVYGDVAVRIGDTVYHFDKEPAPGEPTQLPDPYRLDEVLRLPISCNGRHPAGVQP